MFRIEVTSSDGRACAVTLQVSDHRSDPSSRTLNDIADRLRIPRAEIVDVLLEPFVSRELADEFEDERHVVFGRGADDELVSHGRESYNLRVPA